MFKTQLKKILPSPVFRMIIFIKKTVIQCKVLYFRVKTYVSHKVWQLVNRKEENHLVVCGLSRSGTTMVYNMLRHITKDTSVITFPKEISALKTLNIYSEYIITKRPLDIISFDKIESKLSSFKNVKYLFIVRDIRDCISSLHSSTGEQFFQDLDYQFYTNKDKNIASLSNPGVRFITEEINRLEKKYPHKVKILRYEDFLTDAKKKEMEIKYFSGLPFSGEINDFYKSEIPEALKLQLNGVRPVTSRERPAWTDHGRLEHVLKSYNVFPELDEMSVSLGYETLAQSLKKYNIPFTKHEVYVGTIVAFHTKDEIYSKEAERFQSRIKKLELPLYITSIDRKKNWVDNCAKKPSILLEARKKIRGRILYADVDSYLHKDPWLYLSLYSSDVAAYVAKNGELLSGTLFFNDTSGALSCLERWAERQEQNPECWDQKVLQEIIEEEELKTDTARVFTFSRLPLSMCKIFDKDVTEQVKPYFEHLQVSRVSKWGENSLSVINRNQRIEQLNQD